MDSEIFDKITAIRMTYQDVYNNSFSLLKQIATILHTYNNYSLEEIKEFLLEYIQISPIAGINENHINIVISSVQAINNFLNYFNNAISNLVNPSSQEDIPIVIKDINSLELKKYKDLDQVIKENNPKCMITLTEFEDENLVRVLPCKHIFNQDFIDDWLTKKSHKCPICRSSSGESRPLL